MLIEKEIPLRQNGPASFPDASVLCFDIETTGLSRQRSHLTVIGTGCMQNGHIHFRQWLLERPAAEKEMLQEFSDYLKQFSALLHFNGQAFDIPYVQERCHLCGLPDPFTDLESIDLYKDAKKLKGLVPLENYKQKSLETLFDIKRRDKLSGRDCISAYRHFLQYGDLSARDALLLHNEEDVTGLLELTPLHGMGDLLAHAHLTDACFSADSENAFCFHFRLPSAFPFPVSLEAEDTSLFINGCGGTLLLPGIFCERKLFFPDYKNYYYLPQEDQAVHKSVGIYVDPAHRKKATANTCYAKAGGMFFCQPGDIVVPAFREHRTDKDSWISKKALSSASRETLAALLAAWLKALL